MPKTKVAQSPETFDEQLSRVQRMAHDANGEVWNLARNDRAALLALLDSHRELLALLLELKASSYGAAVREEYEDRVDAAIAKAEGTL